MSILRTFSRSERRPIAAELGFDVTVAIVGVASEDNCFVTVTDQMISYGDFYPATEQGALKTHQFAENWYVNFAASDVRLFPLFFRALRSEVRPNDHGLTTEQVSNAAKTAYSKVFHEHFVATTLTQLGYKTIEDFRRDGLSELGKDAFNDYLTELAKFRLGLEITIFGFNEEGRQRIFEVCDPGRIVEVSVQGYSVLGSGYHMAVASLRRKPMPRNAADMIYRILEAKFTSETATGVGRSTTLATIGHGTARKMSDNDVDAIRAVWNTTLREPTPADALNVIKKSGLVNG